jgi:zinc/manganese transport system ATP-binding protein
MIAAPGTAIRVRELTVTFERRPALKNADGHFAAGSLTAIVGPNGAGKSTLLKAVAGIVRPASGEIVSQGPARHRLAYLPQLPEIDRDFPISVGDTVLLGLWRRIGWLRAAGSSEREEVGRALHAVGLDGFEARAIGTLSTGQFQRVLFARLIAQDAPLILLDEPFAPLDSGTTRDLLRLVEAWHGQGRTVIAVLHDLDQVRAHFPETVLLARSVIAWGPTASVLTPNNLARADQWEAAWDSSPA